jgi:hypothetical protein
MQMLRAARWSYRGFFVKGDGRVFVGEEFAKAGPYGVSRRPACFFQASRLARTGQHVAQPVATRRENPQCSAVGAACGRMR